MTIELMSNSKGIKYAQKGATVLATLSGQLTDNTSILSPTFVITSDISGYLGSFNYFHIPAFKRYYFLTGCDSGTAGNWIVSGEVDAMQSWWTYISKCNAVIARNEISFNLYLNDPQYQCYQNPTIQTLDFPSGFSNPSFILAVSGQQK